MVVDLVLDRVRSHGALVREIRCSSSIDHARMKISWI